MNYRKKLTSTQLYAFARIFNNIHLLSVFAIMIWLPGQTSLAGTNQIDIANKLVTKMMVEVETILATDINDDLARRENVSALFDRYFDLPTIAKFSAGPYWRTADPEQKTDYKSAIRAVIIGTVVRNFDQLSGLKFIPTESQAKGTQLVLVNGTFIDINQQLPSITVGWRVVTADNALPRILDVEIENISMLVTQKQENIAIIRKNDGKFAALIDAMKKRGQTDD